MKLGLRFFRASWFVLCFGFFAVDDATAGWIGRVAFSIAEEYNDNIFFSNEASKKNESDFITATVPTFTVLYVPPSLTEPTFIANLSPSGQIFARHGELTNFGDNVSFDAAYTYQYSRRLTFRADEAMFRGGGTRTGFIAVGQEAQPTTPTSLPPTPDPITLPVAQDLAGLVSKGDVLANSFSVQGAYLARPNITLYGRYGLNYTNFKEGGGAEIANTIGFRGAYSWIRGHNLFAGYSVTFLNNPNAKNADTVIHNIDVGDDYFSLFKIQLSPTLTLSASSGLSVGTGGGGLRIRNNTSVTVIKVWQTAVFNAGMRSGLGSSFGLSSGAAETRTLFTNFGIRLTENLTAFLGGDYTMLRSSDLDINVFRGSGSVQYWITTWLSSALSYSHRWRDAKESTDLVTNGKAKSNSVLLGFTAHFDVWPNVGLSKAPMRPFLSQPGRPPFATPDVSEPTTPQPAAPGSPGPP